ncbi:MAG: OmpA family protein [Lachnospiraceae bacterium]|nr:OmpA family protein [Lachnospiraceae bacterium]
MKVKRKNREAFAEHSYWQSYSDMMAALLLIFVLIIAITLAIYKQKTTDLDQARTELAKSQEHLSATQKELDGAMKDLEEYKAAIDKSNEELANSLAELQLAYANAALTQDELNKAYLEIENGQKELTIAQGELNAAQQELSTTKQELENIVGIRTDIIGALQTTFHNSSMSVDARTGSITFSSDVLFRYNSATLSAESQKTLKEIIPMYLDVLLQDRFREYIAEIIIEGHTDTDGSYKENMELSYQRAYSVAKFCLDSKNGLSEEKIEELMVLLTVNGRSFSQPVYEKDAFGRETDQVDMAASRRVEIKFRLKEDEMIDKISEILKQR